MGERWNIKVVWLDGEEELLMQGQRVAVFSSRSRAEEMRDFMIEGMEGEVQSINVVRAAPQPLAPADPGSAGSGGLTK